MIDQPGTMLAVFAHADDETLLAGGLIAKLVDQGWKVHLLCLAPGDDDRAARMELAAAELGISSVSSLRFGQAGTDSGMKGPGAPPPLLSAPESVVAEQTAGQITTHSPDVIVTHSASGDYGHPDHAYTHRVTVAAARESAGGAKVYALAWPSWMLRLHSGADRIAGFLPGSNSAGPVVSDTAAIADVPVAETHDVHRYLSVRKRAARHYGIELSSGPLPLRMLEAAPTWIQRPILGKARLSRVV